MYVAVTLFAPDDKNVADKVAVPTAGTPVVKLEAVPVTGAGAVPSIVPPEVKVTVPVGPAPLLLVFTVAVRVTA